MQDENERASKSRYGDTRRRIGRADFCRAVFGGVLGVVRTCRAERHAGRLPRARASRGNRGGRADFCFLAVCAAKLLPVLRLPGWQWAWIAAIFALRLAVLALGLYRRIPVPLHTQANRLTGLALFLFPAALRFVPAAAAAPFLCALAAFAAAQECGSVCRMSGVFRGALRRKK